ncbi:MAG: hypothetical protein CMJ18_05990 [Phycisphaeraceae bacterium]|nr:hypothetical protein [Phycisphaeraceae bacterium]
MLNRILLIAVMTAALLAIADSARATLPAVGSPVTLHLEADALGLGNGASVATWGTSDGPANAATASGTAQPTLVTGWSPLGLPGVRFDHDDDRMPLDSAVDAESIVIFAQVDVIGGQQFMLGGNPWKVMGVRSGQWFVADTPPYGTAFSDTTAPHIFTWVRNEELYLDGVGTGSNALNSKFTGSSAITILGDEATANPDNDGPGMTFGEIILFDTALSVQDRQTVEAYLTSKWIIPEPATLSLFAAAGLLALRRQR